MPIAEGRKMYKLCSLAMIYACHNWFFLFRSGRFFDISLTYYQISTIFLKDYINLPWSQSDISKNYFKKKKLWTICSLYQKSKIKSKIK